jgi:hypothetical protein
MLTITQEDTMDAENTTTTTGTVVNKDVMAVVDGKEAGAMVWWDLSGGADPTALKLAWEAEGLDVAWIPEPPAPQVALRRAVHLMREKHRIPRPLEGRKGWSLVKETATGDRLDYSQNVTVTVDPTGQLKIEPPDHDLAGIIRSTYQGCTETLDNTDLSELLIGFTSSLLALALRERGGFYFLPPAKVETFRAAARALKRATGITCYEVPAMRSDGAVAAILAGITSEVLQKVGDLTATLDQGEAGERALQTKVKSCQRTEEKLTVYEELLGKSLDHLHQQLELTRARLTEAVLLAESIRKAQAA